MATSATKRSTPRLSEVARHVVIPEGIASTAWPRVVAKCREVGVEFDEWQHGVGSVALGKREDGTYAATIGGIVLSIPRQVGKTFLVGMIVIALCLLVPGLTVLWTAHRTRTATKTFHTLKGMTERPKVKPFMLDPRLSNGEQEIRFRNGSVIMFGAREQGFGRGFDEVDVEVFDEAQILSERALEDMVPATNQSRQPSGALLFFMGTPPRVGDPGEEFTNRRTSAIEGKSEDMVYVEFSADADAELDDRKQWAKANPSYPHRTSTESMKRMRANLTDDDSFRREALGIWTDNSGSVLPVGAWNSCADSHATLADPVVFAVDVDPMRSRASIAACGLSQSGLPAVEIINEREGVDWVVPRLVELNAHRPAAIIVDQGGPAGALIAEMAEKRLPVQTCGARDVTQACGQLYDSVMSRAVVHRNEPALNRAALNVRKRPVGDAWAWARKDVTTDITPLYAATLALWGHRTYGRRGAPRVIAV